MHPQWLVTGSRFGRADLERECDRFLELDGRPELVIAGTEDPDDQGVDGQVLRWCLSRGLPYRGLDADWDAFGNAAGPIRNQVMVNWLVSRRDVCLAFPARGYSPGTLGCARMAHRCAKVLTYVVDLDTPYLLYPDQVDLPLRDVRRYAAAR